MRKWIVLLIGLSYIAFISAQQVITWQQLANVYPERNRVGQGNILNMCIFTLLKI